MLDIYIYFGLLILALGVWISKLKYLTPALKLVGAAISITLCIEGYAFYLMNQNTNNLHLYHILIPIQYCLFSLVFYYTLTGKAEKKAILHSIPVYLLTVLLIMLYLQTSSKFNSYARLIKDVLLTCWALLYYREIFTGLRVNRLEKEPMFWISTGIFFYSLGNVFVDGIMNHLISQSKELALTLFYISVFLGLLLNCTFLISFIVSSRKPISIIEPHTVDSLVRKHV